MVCLRPALMGERQRLEGKGVTRAAALSPQDGGPGRGCPWRPRGAGREGRPMPARRWRRGWPPSRGRAWLGLLAPGLRALRLPQFPPCGLTWAEEGDVMPPRAVGTLP